MAEIVKRENGEVIFSDGSKVSEAEYSGTAPGLKTPPDLLLKSLQDERSKRRIAEERVKHLEEVVIPDLEEKLKDASDYSGDDDLSGESKALKGEIGTLGDRISGIEESLTRKEVFEAHPIIKERSEEFETFLALPENKGMNLRTAAKAFLAENGLLDPKRPGLENPTGGSREPAPQKYSQEDIANLRKNNFRLYEKLVMEGKI